MSEYIKHVEHVKVPPQTGIEGFLLAIRRLLKLPRIRSIRIDAQGSISAERLVLQEEREGLHPLAINFDAVSPYELVRNAELVDTDISTSWSPTAISHLFDCAAFDKLYPVAFVTGANPTLWAWHYDTMPYAGTTDVFFGLPLHRDRFISDNVLLLCAAQARGEELIHIKRSYKLTLPERRESSNEVHVP